MGPHTIIQRPFNYFESINHQKNAYYNAYSDSTMMKLCYLAIRPLTASKPISLRIRIKIQAYRSSLGKAYYVLKMCHSALLPSSKSKFVLFVTLRPGKDSLLKTRNTQLQLT